MAKETNWPDPPRGHIAVVGWDAANNRWQAVAVDSSGLLQVDLADVADRQANAHGYDGSAWRKLPLLFGYSDTLGEIKASNGVGAGYQQLNHTAVPTGELWVITRHIMYCDSAVPTPYTFNVYDGASLLVTKTGANPGANLTGEALGPFYLTATQYIAAGFNGCAGGENIRSVIFGYKMSIAL